MAKVFKAQRHPLQAEVAVPPAGTAPTAAPPGRFSRLVGKLKHVKGAIVAVAGVGAVLSGLVGWYTTYRVVATTAAAPAGASAPAADGINPLSVMVLPFANQTGDAGKAYIADGMTSSITADASRIRDAVVLPVSTAQSYRDKNLGLKELGQAARVRFVLTGGVRASGDTLRIDAQLSDTASGAQLWSESFEGQLANLFALQDQVTARIGNSMGSQMVILAARDSLKRQDSPKVADLMLRVRALGFQTTTLEASRQMEKLLRQVLALEPQHAGALVRLAFVLNDRGINFGHQLDAPQQAKLKEEADQLLLQAQALDPGDPMLYGPLSRYLIRRGDRTGALKALERWVELDPKNPNAYNGLGLFLTVDDPQRSIAVLKQGLALQDPRQVTFLFNNLAASYFVAGDYRQAIDYANRCTQNNPKFSFCLEPKAWSYALLGELDNAKAATAELLRLDPGYQTSKAALYPEKNATPARLAFNKRVLQAAKLAGIPE